MVEEETLFIPSSDIERRYKEQVKNLLEYNGSKSEIIDMGRLPEVYTALGINDKELKTNGKTILKALGFEGHNKHNVSKETIENLLSLTYDPEALFKSLSVSDNPDAYISVLNAKTEKQEQIIAILSPSHDGQGFTFIPSVYEKYNFERFFEKVNDEQKILYIKDKGSQLWGKLQSLPRHNQEPSTKNILTKNDIVKYFKEKNMAMDGETVLENMSSRAFMIEKLTSRLGKDHQLDWKTALSCINLYKSTFGDEGLAAIDKEIDFLSEYIFEKPDTDGLMQIKTLGHRLYTLKEHEFHNFEDKKAYELFVKNEKENNARYLNNTSFENTQTKVETPIYHIEKLPHIPMKHKNGGIQAGLLQIKEEMIKNGETPALESRNLNSKGKIMSDERQEDPAYDDCMSSLDTSVELKGTPSLSDEEKKQLSPKELAFMNARHQRKLIADAIKSGECVCLPGKDGYADTAPAKNILNPDKFYHGSTLLYLKEVQRQNGFPTGEYITYQKIEEAKKEDKLDVFIEKGQKGISLHINEKNKTTGEYEDKHIRLFNIAQLSKPWEIKKWAEKQLEKEEQERIEYMKTQKGASWEPEPKKPKEPGPEIVCSSTEPEKYLGQYFAAVSMGSKFKVSPEQAAEFSEKMISALYAPIEPKVNKETGEIKPPPVSKTTGEIVTNPFSLDKISIKANEECVNFMRDLRIQTQKQNQPEQKQEQTQSIGRGM